MTARQVFSALGIESSLDALALEWDESEKTFTGRPEFLEPDFIQDASAKFLADESITKTLLESAKRLRDNRAALRLIWHQYYLVAENYDRYWMKCYSFPNEITALGPDARPYYLLLALAGYYLHGDWHKERGIPEEFLKQPIDDFRISVQASLKASGYIGLAGHYSGWWQGLFNGKLYRLGRLTFLQEKYTIGARIFENRANHHILVLADAGLKFNTQGLIALKGEDVDWISEIEENNLSIEGNPILADGYAVDEKISIARSEWNEVVRKDEPVIGVHISPGEPMAIGPCEESFARAIEFNANYFQDIRFRAFVCDSWLLDPNLKDVQPDESNIVQFQKRYYLVPSPRDVEFVTIRTIFGTEALKTSIDLWPQTTSLQKRAVEFKRSGRHFRSGIGVWPWRPWGPVTH